MTVVEKVSRRLATAHYAVQFGRPHEDDRVRAEVDKKWSTFSATARMAIEEIDPALLVTE